MDQVGIKDRRALNLIGQPSQVNTDDAFDIPNRPARRRLGGLREDAVDHIRRFGGAFFAELTPRRAARLHERVLMGGLKL
jgi:hypothetical protein